MTHIQARENEHNDCPTWKDTNQQGQRNHILWDVFCFSLAGSSSARARKKFSFSFILLVTLIHWQQCHQAQSVPTLCHSAFAERDYSCIFGSLPVVWLKTLERTADLSWLQRVKHDQMNCPFKSLCSQCFLFPHTACLCSSAFWSFTGAAVWVPICLHCNYNYYFLSRSTNCISSSFVRLLLNHLLLLSSLFGVKIPWDGVQQGVTEQETNCFWRVPFTYFFFFLLC